MIAVDTNLLVYAHRVDGPEHESAARVLSALAGGQQPWAVPWHCVVEFLANVTNARIWRNTASSAEQALDQVRAWMESPSLVLIGEAPGFMETLADVVTSSGVMGARLHDARIAAICLHHGVSELWTADRDFGRFPKLKTRNPLVG